MSNAKENFKSTSELLDLILKKSGEYTISCGFGYRDAIASIGTTAGNHPGADIPLAEGTPLYSPVDGTIIAARNLADYGQDLFIYDGSYTYFLAHLSSQLVAVNAKVIKGQQVALSGNTGKSTGAHLHFGVYKGKATSVNKNDENWLDPVAFVMPTTAIPTITLEPFTFNTTVRIRTSPSLSGEIRGEYTNGETLNNPTGSVESEGYVWLKYKSVPAGIESYVACYEIATATYYGTFGAVAKTTTASAVGKTAQLRGKVTLYNKSEKAYATPSGKSRDLKIEAESGNYYQVTDSTFSPATVYVKKSDVTVV